MPHSSKGSAGVGASPAPADRHFDVPVTETPTSPIHRLAFAVKRVYYRVKYPKLKLGRGVQIRGRIRMRRGVRVTIGDRTRVNKLVRFVGPGQVTIGNDTLLNETWIGAWLAVTVGERCLLSNCEIVDNAFHNLDPRRRHDRPDASTCAPIAIGDNVWVGSHALVFKGVTVGRDSVIGAAAVVRSDVPPGVVVIGNPQQIVKRFDDSP